MVHDIVIVLDQFRQKRQALWRNHTILLWVFIVSAVLDGLSTIHFMILDGVEYEMHPMIRLVSFWWGPVIGPVFGKSAQVLVAFMICLAYPSMTRALLVIVSILYTAAAYHNFSMYF